MERKQDRFRVRGEWIEARDDKWNRWVQIAEFAGFTTQQARLAIVGALNGSENLDADWPDWQIGGAR